MGDNSEKGENIVARLKEPSPFQSGKKDGGEQENGLKVMQKGEILRSLCCPEGFEAILCACQSRQPLTSCLACCNLTNYIGLDHINASCFLQGHWPTQCVPSLVSPFFRCKQNTRKKVFVSWNYKTMKCIYIPDIIFIMGANVFQSIRAVRYSLHFPEAHHHRILW